MKKKEIITTTTERLVDVSDNDIVDDFMINEFFIDDWISDHEFWADAIKDYDYFWEDYDLTEEDKERIFELIKIEAKKEVEKGKEEEKNLLKDRENILEFINDSIEYPVEGELGYFLSSEEILDTILENGRK